MNIRSIVVLVSLVLLRHLVYLAGKRDQEPFFDRMYRMYRIENRKPELIAYDPNSETGFSPSHPVNPVHSVHPVQKTSGPCLGPSIRVIRKILSKNRLCPVLRNSSGGLVMRRQRTQIQNLLLDRISRIARIKKPKHHDSKLETASRPWPSILSILSKKASTSFLPPPAVRWR